jgi:hypothetical protein
MKMRTKKKSAGRSEPGLPKKEPRLEEIGLAAYFIWEQEGRPQGRDREHWLRAEHSLRLACQEVAAAVAILILTAMGA